MRIGGYGEKAQNTCGCGHGAHCHIPIPGDNICMYSESEGGHPASAQTCQCGGYTPQAAWIIDLCRLLGLGV